MLCHITLGACADIHTGAQIKICSKEKTLPFFVSVQKVNVEIIRMLDENRLGCVRHIKIRNGHWRDGLRTCTEAEGWPHFR